MGRNAVPGFFHYVLPETHYEPKYNPKFSVVEKQNPQVLISKTERPRQISNHLQQPAKQLTFHVCHKNPLLNQTLPLSIEQQSSFCMGQASPRNGDGTPLRRPKKKPHAPQELKILNWNQLNNLEI